MSLWQWTGEIAARQNGLQASLYQAQLERRLDNADHRDGSKQKPVSVRRYGRSTRIDSPFRPAL